MNLKESSLHVSNKFELEEFKKLRKKKATLFKIAVAERDRIEHH